MTDWLWPLLGGLLTVALLALAFGQCLGCGLCGLLAILGQLVTVRLGQVDQRADSDSAARFERLPGIAAGFGVEVVRRLRPVEKQIKPNFVGKLRFDCHADPRPFVTGQVCWDV